MPREELYDSGSTAGIGKIKDGDFSWIRPDGVSDSSGWGVSISRIGGRGIYKPGGLV